MYSLPKNVYRERKDFSKIKTTVPIPNLIEIQRKSYERFLQMNRLPAEREDAGLQSVFKSVFPISDFRENSSLEFIEYSIGNWECKCGKLAGLHHLRKPCSNCGATLIADPFGDHVVLCQRCGKENQARGDVCDICGHTVGMKLKYDVDECQERGMTYAVPLKVTIRLVVWNKDPDTGVKTIRDIKEQEVYFGDIPLMTDNGTFIINGTERVIVSQLHRSPGAFFHSEDKTLYVAQIIPYRGSWVEFEYDQKNLLYVRIDRKRKFLATVFLRALGLRGADEIIRTFYSVDRITLNQGPALKWAVSDSLVGLRAAADVKAGDFSVQSGKKITANAIAALRKAGIDAVPIADEALEGAFAAADIVDPETGEVILEANEELTPRVISMAQEKNVEKIEVFFPERDDVGPIISQTLKKDPIRTHEEALIEIYRRLRPGDPPTLDSSRSLFENMFFNPQKYDFSRVGRLKLNTKLGMNTPLDEKILHPQDFYEVIKYQLKLRKNPQNVDDIDHLGNRRVRSVGELLENQFRIGLVRMERAIKEKMSVYQEMATAMPHDLINAKPVMAAIREFFGSSQLSQFMDQTNPLSEITHKRRLSALGPGGLSRERAGFEVRDVHPTHYGRICPIETPEGPNIGLISSLSCYARINEFGFIESPYRKVKDGRVVDYVIIHNTGGNQKYKVNDVVEADEIVGADGRSKKKGVEFEPYSFYLSAWEEDQYIIAQANSPLDDNGRFVQERVDARRAGDFVLAPRAELQFIDVSPKQLVSVAASLVPFLENDDANRALMGSNMQRQAVPLLRARSPYVGTGMEYITARDSGAVVVTRRGGTVDYVDSQRIVVRVEGQSDGDDISKEMGADIYPMTKFKRSNQNTCINQKPIVRVGQKVLKGQVLADGPCTELGELALGRNVLVAFMPWRGYNFEDAILVSEKMVKEDYYTSIHIEEFEIEGRTERRVSHQPNPAPNRRSVLVAQRPTGNALTLRGHTGWVNSVAWGELEERPVLASGSTDGTVRLWDPASGQAWGEPLTGHTAAVDSVAWGELEGRPVLASGDHDDTVRLWDPASGQAWGGPLTGHTGVVQSVAWGELEGRPVLASGSSDGTVRLWHPARGRARGKPLTGHTSAVDSVAWGELEGRPVLASAGGYDGTVRLWDPARGQAWGEPLTGQAGGLFSVAWGELEGRPVLASASSDGTVWLWDPASGQAWGEPLTGDTDGVTSVAWGELEGRPVLASGNYDGTVGLWDPARGQAWGKPLTGHTAAVTAVAWGELEGRPVLASGSSDGTVRLNAPNKKITTVIQLPRVRALSIHDPYLAVGHDLGLVVLQLTQQ